MSYLYGNGPTQVIQIIAEGDNFRVTLADYTDIKWKVLFIVDNSMRFKSN